MDLLDFKKLSISLLLILFPSGMMTNTDGYHNKNSELDNLKVELNALKDRLNILNSVEEKDDKKEEREYSNENKICFTK